MRLLQLLDVAFVHQVELIAAFLDRLEFLLQRLVLKLPLAEFRVGLVQIALHLLLILPIVLALHHDHYFDARGQVRVQKLPRVRVRREKHLLVNDQTFQSVKLLLLVR